MTLADIYPFDEVAAAFPGRTVEFLRCEGLESIPKIAEEDPQDLHAMALSVWHQVVVRKLHPVDPQAVAVHVDSGTPWLYKKIEKKIKNPVFEDILWIRATVEEFEVSNFAVARTYPGDLHLGDVMFSNPDRPLPAWAPHARFRKFHGLGLLPTVLERVERYARQEGCPKITLEAANDDLMRLFEKYGYVVEDTVIGALAKQSGMGIPVEKIIRD